jgi:DNA polymerase
VTVRAERYLAEIGIAVYKRREFAAEAARAPSAPTEPGVVARVVAEPLTPASTSEAWERLAAEVRACTLCGLHKTRTQTVFGVGRRDADLLVIGEAPGADEDRQGEPFVGRAGQLLNAMLRAIGLPRSEVYIANILKCRPPGNRDPQPEEASLCTPYLSRQIALVNPRAILAVGRISAQWLLQTDSPIGRLRGRVFRYGESGTPLVVTYHPAYLLRSPLQKATAWTDLCTVKELLQRRA